MTRYPGALWRPMPGQESRPKRRKGRGVGYHIAVSERTSIYDINLGTGNDAHLYVLRDGTVEQNVDLDVQAWAGRDGNSSMIWVETQGGVTYTDVKTGRWNPAQAETLAQIAAWAHQTEGVPLQLMPDSRPGSRGLGTHRLGIDPWRILGGELWSSARGKECPGDARIAQLPEIVARAQQIANPPQEEDDMYDENARAELLVPLQEVLANARTTNGAVARLEIAVNDTKTGLSVRLAKLEELVAALASPDPK